MKYNMNLRLFDEGGSEGGGAATTSGAAATTGAAAGGEGGGERDFEAEFAEMIQGEYKGAYEKQMQAAMQQQRQSGKKTATRLQEAESLLALVGERYGQDGTDLAALRTALEGDKKYLEAEALEKGMTVEQLAEFKRMERENKAFQRQMEEARDRQLFEQKLMGWNQEAEALQQIYPEFELLQEFENPQFVRMLDNGVDMKTAYQAVHFDDLMSGALQHTAAQTEKKVVDSIKARGTRPEENGTRGSGGAREKLDVSKLTKEQRTALMEEAMRNPEKRITFT